MTSEKPIMWGAAAVVLAAIAALYYFYVARGPVQVAAPPPSAKSAAPAPAEPAIEHPVPPGSGEAPSQPLPALNDSDQPISAALTAVPGDAPLANFLVPQDLVRHIVATVDNLPRKKVAVGLRPLKPPPGEFAVAGSADHLTLSPDNYKRYTPFVDLVKAVDVKQLAAAYFRFYPLFQQAYEDLGYPTEYFNDRVIEVIDHLLETPDVKGPIALVQPNVMYLYADPQLEALSAGQKTLIRMGPENEGIIKAKLRELRVALATRPPAAVPAQGPAPRPEPTYKPSSTSPSAPPAVPPPAGAAPAPRAGAPPGSPTG